MIFGLPVEALAQESAEGVIDGQVINGTEGGGVSEIEVTLITYVNDVMAETRTAGTDSEGRFRFDDVAMEHEYLVSAKYMEVDYYYPVAFESGETATYVEVGVCDATASDESISIGLAHTVINVEEESLLVTEVFWLVNDGDRTYVGTDGVLVFTLPEGATDFEAPQEVMMDYRFLGGNRLAYLVPFPPGERQLVFAYRLAKKDSAEFTTSLAVDYPTENLELMVGGEDIEVATNQLAPAEPVITNTGERFIHFRGENLASGTVINIYFSNLSGDGGLFFVIPWVIITIVIVGIAVYLLKKGRRGKTSE
ncbi:hypothetical protein ACFLXX_01135 [Chloroflexota bacterium]